MRMRRCAARASSNAGTMVLRKCSNGILSRKKKDSFVVIASTTSQISGSAPAPLSLKHQIAQCAEARPARDRQQPALDQILLVGGQHEAGAFAQQPAQKVVVVRGHGRPPENRRTILGAI